MNFRAITLLTACALLAACSSNSKQTDFASVNQAADSCTRKLQTEHQFNISRRIPASTVYVNRPFTEDNHISYRAIPYFAAASIDKGNPGSAWRNCMARNNVATSAINS